MPASVTQLFASTPQPAPAETDEADQAACFTRAMYDACIAEGYRRACEEFGIPYFPPAFPSRARHLALSAPGPAS